MEPVRQAVILAAGQGTRLRQHDEDCPKPLFPVCGKALVGHVVEAFVQQGVREFFVVVGFRAEELVPGLRRVMPTGTVLHLVENTDWRLSNGVSLLKAENVVHGRFFLSMSDHLFQTEMLQTLIAGGLDPLCLYLAVDRKLEEVFDMEDATKVSTQNGRILGIGKDLQVFDAVDTGLFLCPETVFSYLRSAMQDGNCSLSDGVRHMAAKGMARVVDIGSALWQDVDTQDMLVHAERVLGLKRCAR